MASWPKDIKGGPVSRKSQGPAGIPGSHNPRVTVDRVTARPPEGKASSINGTRDK